MNATTENKQATTGNRIETAPNLAVRPHTNPLRGSLYTFHGHTVLDVTGRSIGTVDWIWSDNSGTQGEFLGVNLRWLRGTARVIPARDVVLDPTTSTLRVPYAADQIKRAPRVAIDRQATDEQIRAIHAHYSASPARSSRRARVTRVTA